MKAKQIRTGDILHAVVVTVSKEGVISANYQHLTVINPDVTHHDAQHIECRNRNPAPRRTFIGDVCISAPAEPIEHLPMLPFFSSTHLSRLFKTPSAAWRYANRLNREQLSYTEQALADRWAAYGQKPVSINERVYN
ncbi:MAG: hypothetical protein RSD49_12005 [Hafnia sp.]